MRPGKLVFTMSLGVKDLDDKEEVREAYVILEDNIEKAAHFDDLRECIDEVPEVCKEGRMANEEAPQCFSNMLRSIDRLREASKHLSVGTMRNAEERVRELDLALKEMESVMKVDAPVVYGFIKEGRDA